MQHSKRTLEMHMPSHKVKLFALNQPFLQCYNLQICLCDQMGQEYSKWEALIAFLSKLQAIDHTIKFYPWKAQDQHQDNPPIKLALAPHDVFNLETCIPCLVY